MRRRRQEWRSGDYLMCCDRCGFTIWASEAKKTWDGLYVCEADWEPRHPQDFVRGVPDRQTVPVARPRPQDVFLTILVSRDDL